MHFPPPPCPELGAAALSHWWGSAKLGWEGGCQFQQGVGRAGAQAGDPASPVPLPCILPQLPDCSLENGYQICLFPAYLPAPLPWLPIAHTMKLKFDHGLQGPRVCPACLSNLVSQLCLTHCPPSTLALLFLQPGSTSGPLHLLCSLAGTLKPSVLALVAFFSSFRFPQRGLSTS